MPNTGRPSKGCFSCRQRRIRCDLARPECTQCTRLRMNCPGYRDETSMYFRNVKASSFEKQETRTGRRMKLHYDQPGSTRDTSNRPNSSLPVELPQTWSQHVIPLILDKFSIGRKTSSIFATVNRMVSMAEQGSTVYAVANAIACAYRASVTGSDNARSNMVHAYGNALRTVKTALDDPVEYKEDSTLLAVWMFVVYEFLSNAHLTTIAGSEEGDRHCQGMASLIALRGPEQFTIRQGQDLIWFVCHCTQAKALIARRESPPEVLTWLHQLDSQTSEYDLIQTCTFSYHCTRLCNQIKGLLLGTLEQLVYNAPSIIQQMEEIEKIKAALDTGNASPSSSYSSGVYVYQGNFQLHLSTSVLMCLSIATQATGVSLQQRTQFIAAQQHSISVFRETASSILGIDYHSIGWGDAVMVLAGLRTIATSRISLPVQRDGARRILGIVKEQSGFRIENT